MFKLYNALSKRKEEFNPINPGKAGLYVCGPTVYDHCHLGHARGYVSMDVLRRFLEYLGFEVRHIMNYTDVGHLVNDAETGEDKIEKKAKKEKIDPIEIANTYIESCEEDFEALNIEKPHFTPRPTRYIVQIIEFVKKLIEKGYAYEANGSVYFSVDKFPQYGKLSGRKKDELIAGERIEVNPEKKNPLDFAVWIKATPEHILKWESPWSLGYPGWHIECSVMSNDLLGQDTFDIHGGGNENKFPHNENEIAQSEAYLGKKMANYWVLWNMVNINDKKMSKSLGNQTSAKDAIKKYGATTVRLWILSSHYRSIINFGEDSLRQSEANLKRISDFINNLINFEGTGEGNINLDEYKKKFEEAMNDDLNTPLALSTLYELITETNKLIADGNLGKEEAQKIITFWKRINKFFGLEIAEKGTEIPEEIIALAEKRKSAKAEKNYEESDKLRKEIEEKGYLIEDVKGNGYKISKK